jgi:polysaccharide deacetylase 2 family uncharacterized protein YibQ
MAADELNKPLGLASPRRPRRRGIAIAAAAGCLAFAAGVAAVAWLTLAGGNGGPTVTAAINAPGDARSIAAERTGSTTPAAALTPIDGGLTDINSSDATADEGQVVIYDPANPPAIRLAALPDAALVETTGDGLLPRIADDGTRPLDAYARPSAISPRESRVAIVVGGLGIDAEGTRKAIAALPGDVTLAFAPYGDDLAVAQADARASGHEILLQVPLEPFNYPATDPGPNTLVAGDSPEENLERLRWFLGRLTNYVGVVNYMGARFTGEPDALAPVIEEIGRRGLLYLDDGSSPRSRAGEMAGAAPFLRADMVLDADLNAAAIDQRLRRLQAIARERGYAIATATAFPASVERIAAFARAAPSRGIAIVPLSALVTGRP